MPKPKHPLKVFLCHASADKPKVRELYRYLRKRGIQPWLDAEDLLPGQNWQVEIPKAIASSDAIIICLSTNSVDKEGYVQKEIKFALDKALEMPDGRIFIIPARLDECEVPFTLKPFHWVDLFDTEGYTRLMKSLKLRASQLERATVQLPKQDDTNSNLPGKSKEASQEGVLVHIDGDVHGNIIIGDQNTVQLQTPQTEPEQPAEIKPPAITEKKESKKLTPHLKTPYVIAIIGAAATIIAALIGILPQYFNPAPLPPTSPTINSTSVLTTTSIVLPPSATPRPSVSPTKAFTQTSISLPTEITDAKGVSMQLVPEGNFTMGSNNGSPDEKPTQSVYLDTFYVDRYEVTNKLYADCVNAGVCSRPKQIYLLGPTYSRINYVQDGIPTDLHEYRIDQYYDSESYKNFPVVSVNWSMAKTYCEWRDARLPTEAEWEKAARGTDGRAYPWGNEFSCSSGNFFDFGLGHNWDYTWNPGSNRGKSWLVGPTCDETVGTASVGSFPSGSSPYSVDDLSGNVSEWVNSLYKPYPYNYINSESSQGSGERVFRGGSFYSGKLPSRSSTRQSAPENYSAADLGFRCARSTP